MRGKLFVVWGLFAFIFAAAQTPTVASAQEAGPTWATVTVDKLNVRAKGAKEAPLLGQLSKGDIVPVKKVRKGWAQLGWSKKSYVFQEGLDMPAGKPNKKAKYEDMREAFIDRARAEDKTIQWLEVPRASGIIVRFHWREYKSKADLIQRAEALAHMYSVMTTGETGIEIEIVSGNDTWAKAFY
jgi:hypothetical protein